MFDFKPVLLVNGSLLSMLSVFMLLPALVDFIDGNNNSNVFLLSACFTLFFGLMMIMTNRVGIKALSLRQAFLLTTVSWVNIVVFSAIPLVFSSLQLSYVDSFFEVMSGITTTGSTILINLDNVSPGILLWRSLLQWLGGIGIVVMGISILPTLKVGGMQLFRMEFAQKMDKTMPRATQMGLWIVSIYVILTGLCTALYKVGGMSWFDAINHAMTTVATGGYSTHDASIGYFESAFIEYISAIFMVLGSLPFLLYVQAIRSNFKTLIYDSQVKVFLLFLVVIISIVTIYLVFVKDWFVFHALSKAVFNIISIVTGTGYISHDFSTWGNFSPLLFFFLMFVGGCAGSTTCGIKIFRWQILYENLMVQLRKLLQPNGIFLTYYNNKPMENDVSWSVMSFFFVFIAIFAIVSLILSFMGLDLITAIGVTATSIANVGPSIGGEIGPTDNFSALSDGVKWILSFTMLIGRLEIFTVLILFLPRFWLN